MSVSARSSQVSQLADVASIADDEVDARSNSILARSSAFVASVIALMCKEVENASFFVGLGFLIEFLQLLSFPLYDHMRTAFPWNASVTSWLGSIAAAFRVYGFIEGSVSATRIAFYIISGVLILFALVFAWVGAELQELNGKAWKFPTVVRFLRVLSDLFFTGPLFVPVVGCLWLQFLPQSAVSSTVGGVTVVSVVTTFDSSSGDFIGHAIGAAIVLFIYLLVAALLAGTYYERFPTAAAVLSRPHARGALLQLLVKFVLVTVFTFTHTLDVNWVPIIICFLSLILLAHYVQSHLPYYRFAFNTAHACTLYGAAWAAFCLVLVQLTNVPTQQGISLLFFIVFPLALLAASLLVRMRRALIERTPMAALDSSEEVELKARFAMESMTDELRTAVISNVEVVMDDEKKSVHAALFGEAVRYLAYGTKRFPTPSMFLVHAQYVLCYANSPGQGLAYIARAEQRDRAVDEMFTCHFFRKRNEEMFNNSEQNADVINYMLFQQVLTEARRQDEAATQCQSVFWSELLKTETSVSRLSQISIQLNDSMIQAQDSFRRLMRLNANSAQVLRMYASFLCDVANDPLAGNKLIARADSLEDARSKSHDRGEQTADLFDDTNALITISGDLTSLGAILDVNMGAVRLFGHARADLMGSNINVIMPPPFSVHHQTSLIRFLETGESTVLNRSRIVFGAHKSGWLVPLDLFVREVATPAGMTFLGVLRTPSSSQLGTAVAHQRLETELAGQTSTKRNTAFMSESEVAQLAETEARQRAMILSASQGAFNISVNFALTDASLRITSCTAGCAQLFGITPEEVRAHSVELSRWAPEFKNDAALREIRSPAGLALYVRTAGSKAAASYIHIMQALVRVGSDECYLTHFCERPAPKEAGDAFSDEDQGDDDDDDGMEVSDGEPDAEDAEDESDHDESDDDEVHIEIDGQAPTTVMSLSADSLKVHDQAHGNKEIPLFDKSNLAKRGKGKAAKARIADQAPKKRAGVALRTEAVVIGVSQVVEHDDEKHELTGNPLFAAGALQDAPSAGKVKGKGKAKFNSKGDKAHSQSSKSSRSKSSASSASVLHSKLATFARGSQSLDMSAGISNLRSALALVLLFVIAIAIIRHFVLQAFTSAYLLSINTVFQAGQRRSLAVRMVTWAHNLLMAELVDGNNVYWSNFWTEAQVSPKYNKGMLNTDMNEFTAINKLLYIDRRSQLSASHLALYTQPSVTMHHLFQGTNYFDLQVPLWDAMQQFTAAAQRYRDFKIVNIVDTDQVMFEVLRNGVANKVGDLFYWLNATTFLYQEDALSSLTAMRGWSYAFMIAGIFSVFLVALLIVQPRVTAVEKNKEEVLLLFGDIPVNLVQIFARKAMQRLSTLKAASSGQASGGMEQEGTEGADDMLAISTAVSAAAALSGEPTPAEMSADEVDREAKKALLSEDDDDEEVDEATDEGKAAKADSNAQELQAAAAAGGKKRRAKHTRERIVAEASFVIRHLTMIKVFFIVFISLVYFSVSFMLQFGYLEAKLGTAAAQINWSQHRRLSIQMLVYQSRHILTQSFWKMYEAGASGIEDVTETDFFTTLQLMDDMEIGLAFGSTRFGLLAPSTNEESQRQLTFRNACNDATGAPSNLDGCKDFMGGVMTHGLHAAMQQFSDTARTAYALINATLKDPRGDPTYTQYNAATSAFNLTRVLTYLGVLNSAFHSPSMDSMMNASEVYIDYALAKSGVLYQQSVQDLVDLYTPGLVGMLVAFCCLCLFAFFAFYQPMCWALDADQKRTTALLLLIPADIMERLPTIRDFVAKMDSRTV